MEKCGKYLLGDLIDHFDEDRLPTKLCVLKYLLYILRAKKITYAQSAHLLADLLIDFYKRRGCATITHLGVKKKILRLHQSYLKVCSRKKYRIDAQIKIEAKFIETVREVFTVEKKIAPRSGALHDVLTVERNVVPGPSAAFVESHSVDFNAGIKREQIVHEDAVEVVTQQISMSTKAYSMHVSWK